MTTLSLSSCFSNHKNPSISLSSEKKQRSRKAINPLVEFRKNYTQNEVLEYVFDSLPTDRISTCFLGALVSCYDPNYTLDSKEQKKNLPTSLKLRRRLRCNDIDYASVADLRRMSLEKDGIIVSRRQDGEKAPKISLSHKFYMMFCLHKLKGKWKDLIKRQTSISNFTKDHFKERTRIETQISNLEKKIRNYGAKTIENKTPDTRVSGEKS